MADREMSFLVGRSKRRRRRHDNVITTARARCGCTGLDCGSVPSVPWLKAGVNAVKCARKMNSIKQTDLAFLVAKLIPIEAFIAFLSRTPKLCVVVKATHAHNAPSVESINQNANAGCHRAAFLVLCVGPSSFLSWTRHLENFMTE